MRHLVTVIEELLGGQVGSRALCDGAIDTTTASGELIFHIFSALAQFERRLIQERTRAGLAAARARGRKGERRPRRAEEPRVHMAYTMYVDQQLVGGGYLSDLADTRRRSIGMSPWAAVQLRGWDSSREE